MKRKFKRLLLSVFLAVFMCTCLAGCKEPTDVSDIQVTNNDQTITVSSPYSNAFVLSLELEKNGETYSWTSENLYIAADVSQSYVLKDLVGTYTAEDCQITSICVYSANITSLPLTLLLVAAITFVISFLIGFALGCFD